MLPKTETTPPADDGQVDRRVRRRGKEYATLTRILAELRGGKIVSTPHICDVEVMARAKGYAMVRRGGCKPFVVSERDLTPNVRAKGLARPKRADVTVQIVLA
jgi:hypothetical protein